MAFELGANALINVKYHKKFHNSVKPKLSGLAVITDSQNTVEKHEPQISFLSIIVSLAIIIIGGLSGRVSSFLIMPGAIFVVIYGIYQRFGLSSIIFRLVTMGIIIFNMWLIYTNINPLDLTEYNSYLILAYFLNIAIIVLLLVYFYNNENNINKFKNYLDIQEL